MGVPSLPPPTLNNMRQSGDILSVSRQILSHKDGLRVLLQELRHAPPSPSAPAPGKEVLQYKLVSAEEEICIGPWLLVWGPCVYLGGGYGN